jgi:hypothetical protein
MLSGDHVFDKTYGVIAFCAISMAAALPAVAAPSAGAVSDDVPALVFGSAQLDSVQQADGAVVLGHGTLIAAVGAGAMQGAIGNFGVNVAAGADNVQSNLLTVVTSGQQVSLRGAQNASLTGRVRGSQQAVLGAGALANATGNIGLNLAAGAGNLQQNSLAVR